jgi:hypothetical protein
MLVRAKPAGFGILEKLTSAQINLIDGQLPSAIDGVAGGVYAPSSEIEIGGSGILVTGPATLEGDVSIGDDAGSQLTIYADTFVNRDVAFVAGKKATFNGQTEFNDQNQFDDIVVFTASGFVTFSGTVAVEAGASFDVACLATFQDDVSVAGDIIYSGALAGPSVSVASGAVAMTATTFVTSAAVGATFNGLVTLANGVALTSLLAPIGAGRVRGCRPPVTTADANSTYGITDGDVFLVPALGAARTYSLSTTGAGAGDRMRFSAIGNTTVNPANLYGGLQALMNNTGGVLSLDVVFDGAAWVIESIVRFP